MFKFKGISSIDMQVVIEEEEHFLAKAAQRYEVTEIEGRDDAIFDELGYSYIERPIYIQCLNPNRLDDILAWLDGEGDLEYNGRKTKARFYAELEPIRTAGIKIIDTNFIRAPFWEKAEDNYIEVINSIKNEGNKVSRPIIKIERGSSDSIELTLGGVRFKYTFGENDTYVEIDCEKKTTIYEGINRSRNIEIGYKFPKLEVGDNAIVIHKGSAIINVKRKDRWL
jgi:phage-related protein